LTDCLNKKGDFSNTERFAEQIYSNLRDIENGIDQEGEIVADAAYYLADIIFRQHNGDLIKAEELAREAIRIVNKLDDAQHSEVSENYLLLAKILQKQEKFGNETKELYERS
jgi:hypothetical protein